MGLRSGSVGRPEDPFLTSALIVGGSALALGALVLGVGHVGGVLFGSGPPGATLSDVPGVLSRLPSTLDDPAAAWPAPGRDRLPGPLGLYGAAALVVTVASLLGVIGTRLWRWTNRRGSRRRGAKWGRPAELRSLVVRRSTPGRITLGRCGRRLVAAESRQSVCVLAPTQAGKTTGLAIPAILEWPGPVIATSVKRDLLDDTLAARRARGGRIWVFDPTDITGCTERAGWTPLGACGTWSGAVRTADALTSAAQPVGDAGLESASFWYQAASKLLAPMVLAAARSHGSMGRIVTWLDRQEEQEVSEILADAGSEAASDAWMASMRREERQLSSIYTTAEQVLAAYADPTVSAAAERSEISPVGVLDGRPNTLYLCAPAHEQQRLAPLFVTLISSIVDAVSDAHGAGRPPEPPVLLVLDEAANVAPLPQLPQIASTAAGMGLQLVTVWQDLAQIATRYGRAADTVVNNHRAKVVLSGITCPRTLEYVARLLGDEAIDQRSYTLQAGGGRSEQRSTSYRALAGAEVVRQMPPSSGILVYGHLPPARLRLRRWFDDRGLRRLAEGRR